MESFKKGDCFVAQDCESLIRIDGVFKYWVDITTITLTSEITINNHSLTKEELEWNLISYVPVQKEIFIRTLYLIENSIKRITNYLKTEI